MHMNVRKHRLEEIMISLWLRCLDMGLEAMNGDTQRVDGSNLT